MTRPWNPRPRFFDLFSTQGFEDPSDFYMPFTRALDLQMRTGGRNSCRGKLDFTTWDQWLQSNCVWVTPCGAGQRRGRRALSPLPGKSAADQQKAGRFNWAPNVRLRNVVQWLDYEHVVPPESRMSLLVSVGFFLICLINTIGLLLAKVPAPCRRDRRAPRAGRHAAGDLHAVPGIEAATVAWPAVAWWGYCSLLSACRAWACCSRRRSRSLRISTSR